MPEQRIFKYAMNTEPFIVGKTPVKIEEEPEEEVIDPVAEAEAEAEKILSEAAEQSELILSEAFQRSREAEEKLKDADLKSKVLIQETQNECEQIIADTKKRADEDAKKTHEQAQEAGHKEGHKKGYSEGYKDGIKQGRNEGEAAVRKEMQDAINQANAKAEKTIQDAKEQTSEYFIRAEDDIVKVVLMAIEKILPQHFLDAPQVILPVVHQAIQYVRDQKEIKIHVEPDSYDLVLMARSEFQSMLTDGAAILEVVSDESLKPGDCILETPNGGVDARLSTQLELMKDAIKKVLHK